MNRDNLEQFSIVGIAIRTTNENGQSSQDIPELWARFVGEDIMNKISNKVSEDIYAVYTDYELDHTKPYTTILGCKVSSMEDLAEGFVSKVIGKATYEKRTAKGSILQGSVYNEWINIWNASLPRSFVADFEVYSTKALDPENAEVDIYIGVE